MANSKSDWQFAPNFDENRKKNLISVSSISEVIERIVQDMKIPDNGFKVCHGKNEIPKNCVRPKFKLEVKPETFDLFFNSPYGYRAQYLHDPEEGQKQNSKLIYALTHKLMECAKGKNTEQDMTNKQIEKSLRCCSTKIWIWEKHFDFRNYLNAEIRVPKWLEHAKKADGARFDRELTLSDKKAIWGVRAPEGTVLEVKGAFLDSKGNEVVASSKINRRFEIHEYGFS